LDYTVKIGGEAGQGIQTIGDALGKVFARSGYHVFTHQDYESRIRGGHNFLQIRVSERPVACSRARADIVLAFDRQSVAEGAGSITPAGVVVYDPAMVKEKREGWPFLEVPFIELATQNGGSRIMANTVATGAVLGMMGLPIDAYMDVLGEVMAAKGEKTVEENRKAAARGRDYAIEHCKRCSFGMAAPGRPRMLIDGNAGIGLGAVLSGCTFYSGYPMTPSTGVLLFMAGKAKEYGIVVEQAEDEIAAVNMVIGASFAGARAMTATAGGGFALMVEGVSLAAMTETPLVIAVGQRPAPSTGLPTRTEQGDLLFVINAGHGEFPKAVFAPGSPEQALYLTNKAFDLSEKYQIPAIVLTDQYLADSSWTYEGFDLAKVVYKDYRLRDGGDGGAAGQAAYKRYAFTPSGVSPLAVPGSARQLVVEDSDEHDEEGHLIEDGETRVKMVQKRLHRKLPSIRKEIAPPALYGSRRPQVVLVGWGSTYGVLREAVDALSARSEIALLHFSEVWPFPSTDAFDYLGLLRSAKNTISVENNATSQLARLLKAETGFACNEAINRYDGRPYLLETILEELDGRLA
jgi:2-oxoglutarate ferredoxin oxidoreductase subunit alpha